MIGTTQVGKMLMDEGMQEEIQKGDMEKVRRTAFKMLKRGDSLRSVAEILELPTDTIRVWKEEACTIV